MTNITGPSPEERYGWVVERDFVGHVEGAAEELGLDVEWMSHGWIARVGDQDKSIMLFAYTHPLNPASSAAIAKDKAGTYAVLENDEVPAIPHHLIRFQDNLDVATVAEGALEETGFPAVVKPNDSSGGRDVITVHDLEQAHQTIATLQGKYLKIVASPWVDIKHEWRVVMLDEEPQLTFEKHVSPDFDGPDTERRHNLLGGATPEITENHPEQEAMNNIARRAMGSLGLRFASVDLVMVGDEIQVLEVNGAVSIEKFSKHSPENRAAAADIYAKALKKALRIETPLH